MSRHILRALSFAIFSAFLPLSNALAHCIVGGRFFPQCSLPTTRVSPMKNVAPDLQYNSAKP